MLSKIVSLGHISVHDVTIKRIKIFFFFFIIQLLSYNGERLAAPGEPKDLIDVGEEDLLETTEKEFGTLLAER